MTNERDRVQAVLLEHSRQVVEWVSIQLAYLGSREEWSMDDNFDTVEGLAALAGRFGLPSAGDQSPEALRFWRAAASQMGVDDDPDASDHPFG